jgi:DNA-binding transcriptional LysR family regulator
VSQPALSQTVSGLERQLGVKLLVRGSAGVRATEAGTALLGEARAVLARHDQALRAMPQYTGPGGGGLWIGIPPELPSGLLDPATTANASSHKNIPNYQVPRSDALLSDRRHDRPGEVSRTE